MFNIIIGGLNLDSSLKLLFVDILRRLTAITLTADSQSVRESRGLKAAK